MSTTAFRSARRLDGWRAIGRSALARFGLPFRVVERQQIRDVGVRCALRQLFGVPRISWRVYNQLTGDPSGCKNDEVATVSEYAIGLRGCQVNVMVNKDLLLWQYQPLFVQPGAIP